MMIIIIITIADSITFCVVFSKIVIIFLFANFSREQM